ncbi:MAG: AEC family transporter [Oscillospiraceae bacterium]
MLDIIMRAGSFISIILMGYLLKKIGFFKQEDFTVLSKITIRITLPCAIITSFAGKTIDPGLLSLAFLAIGCGVVYIVTGYMINRKHNRDQQAFEMLNLPGYNIGTFVIPFAQSFLGAMGVIAVSLFDTGNAVICLGGAFSIAAMVKDGGGFSAKRIVKALVRSVPFMTYMTMLLLNLLKLQVPGFVMSVAGIGSNANAFMAMLMIGVGFKLELGDKKQVGTIMKLLAIRYSLATAFALIFYFLLPFDLEVRQALVILAFSPIGSAVPGFTEQLKGDVGLSSALNSFAMVISITITVVLLLVML